MRRTARMVAEAQNSSRSIAAAIAIAGTLVLVSSTADAKESLTLEQARTAFTIAELPAAALTVGDARKLLEKAPKNRAAVIVVGRIAAREGEDPFLDGKASFVLMDLPDDDHSSKKGHDADNCPFCKRRKAKAAMAAVQFVDAAGAVVPLDARKLFGVSEDAKVVIRGQGYFNPKLPFPIVQLNAEGIHVIESGSR
jgi:uncharacterized protein YdeI (BOF family)